MIPGGPEGRRKAIQIAADVTTPIGVSQIRPGYRVGSRYCVFFHVKRYIQDGNEPHWQENQVISVFTTW